MSNRPQTPTDRRPPLPDPGRTTPQGSKQTSSQAYGLSGNLKSKREIMLEEVGIWIVPVEHIEDLFVLPPWLARRLQELPSAGKHLRGSVWNKLDKCFTPDGEAKPGKTEKVIYDHLKQLHAPRRQGLRRSQGRKEAKGSPHSAPPDATTLVNVPDMDVLRHYRWRYIITVFEFKVRNFRDLHGEMGRENAEQLMWDLQHMLWENVDRRFSVGMTIEGTEARLWIACRTAVLARKTFNIIKDRQILFRALAFFAFADDVALGRDTTMTSMAEDTFKVVIANKRYLVKKNPLADTRARALIGSGCRVYKAYRVNEDAANAENTDSMIRDKTNEVVIKEVWRDAHRRPEAQIYSDVMEAILLVIKNAKNAGRYIGRRPPSKERTTRKFFVGIGDSEDVRLDDNRRDHTTMILRDEGLSTSWRYIDAKLNQPVALDNRNGAHMPSAGGLDLIKWTATNPFSNDNESPAIHPRIHNRTVMVNVGVPLHDVDNLEIAFSALGDGVHACRLMCLAGYNHRDLSSGNIIVDIESKRGWLGDLEFAKLHGTESSGHNIRTGTPKFMALEVLLKRYRFGEWPDRGPQHHFHVRHNAGHDLESILWIAVFMLYNSLVFEPENQPIPDKLVDQLTLARAAQRAEIFDYHNRSDIFRGSPGGLSSHIDAHVDNRAAVIAYDHIRKMEVTLKEKYKEFETKLSDSDRGQTRNHEFLPVHDVFEEELDALSALFKNKICIGIGAR